MRSYALKCSVASLAVLSAAPVMAQDEESVSVSTEQAPVPPGEADIVVTGTRIQGISPASPLTVITRAELDGQGISSVEEALRYIPQNFSEVTSSAGVDGRAPSFSQGATTINLRGLGEGATLVLINGKRIAPSAATNGTFTDVSTIPFGAIERIEVLTDGASAVYGSDAIGGVVNFILKENYTGFQVNARYEDSTSGGDSYSFEGTGGIGWGGGNLTFGASYEHQDAVDRFDAGLTDIQDFTAEGGRAFPVFVSQEGQNPFRNPNLLRSVVPETENYSFFANGSQDISDTLTLNLSGLYSKRTTEFTSGQSIGFAFVPPSNFYSVQAGIPFPQFASYAFHYEVDNGLLDPAFEETSAERYSIGGSLDWDMPMGDWKASIGVNLGRDTLDGFQRLIDTANPDVQAAFSSGDPAIALNLFGDGTEQRADLNSLQSEISRGERKSKQDVYSLDFSGSLFDAPAGAVKVSLGGEIRQESTDFSEFVLNPIGFMRPELESFIPEVDNTAVYAEIFVPILADKPGFHDLSLQLAGRYDNYDYEGPFGGIDAMGNVLPFEKRSFDDFVPRVGVVWSPVEELKLRGTWGEAFQAPTVPELFDPPFTDPNPFSGFAFDPLRPAAFGGPGFAFFPGTFGGNPDLLPQKSDTITVGFDWKPEFIDDFEVNVTYSYVKFEDRITSLFAVFGTNLLSPDNFPLLNPDLFPGLIERDANGLLTRFDTQIPINLSERTSESIDFNVRKGFDVGPGSLQFRVFGTHTTKLVDVIAEGVERDVGGTELGPSDWRINGGVDYFGESWSASVSARYSSGYTLTSSSALIPDVEGYTTVNLSVGKTFGDSGFRLRAGINNLFDAEFPFLDGPAGVDTSRVDLRRRVGFIDLTKEF